MCACDTYDRTDLARTNGGSHDRLTNAAVTYPFEVLDLEGAKRWSRRRMLLYNHAVVREP